MKRELPREKIVQLEFPDDIGMISFLSVEGRDGFTVTVSRRKDMGVCIVVRQDGPRGSSMFRDTEFEVDPFDTGEDPENEDEGFYGEDEGFCADEDEAAE